MADESGAVEYEFLKLKESAYDPVRPSKMEATVLFDRCAGEGGKVVRRIERRGQVVSVTCVSSGRSVEFPWSQVRHAVRVGAKQPQLAGELALKGKR